MTTTTMKTEYKFTELRKFAERILRAGFRIYTLQKEGEQITHFSFVEDDNIGYVQADHIGMSFNTVHVPNRRCASGFRVQSNLQMAGVHQARECFCSIPPQWSYEQYGKDVKKWSGWDAYAKSHGKCIVYRELFAAE